MKALHGLRRFSGCRISADVAWPTARPVGPPPEHADGAGRHSAVPPCVAAGACRVFHRVSRVHGAALDSPALLRALEACSLGAARRSLGLPRSRDARRPSRDPAARPLRIDHATQFNLSRTCTCTIPPPWRGRTSPPPRPAHRRLRDTFTGSRRRGASSTSTGAMIAVSAMAELCGK